MPRQVDKGAGEIKGDGDAEGGEHAEGGVHISYPHELAVKELTPQYRVQMDDVNAEGKRCKEGGDTGGDALQLQPLEEKQKENC